jgi:hypothetical protein
MDPPGPKEKAIMEDPNLSGVLQKGSALSSSSSPAIYSATLKING